MQVTAATSRPISSAFCLLSLPILLLTFGRGQVPKLGQCIPCEDDGLHTRCTRIDANCIQLLASLHDWNCVQLSKNAGRYLCEFIFYTSLYHTSVPTIFIHVPSEGWSQEDINACLHSIVKSICHHPTVRQKGWKSHLYRWYLQLKLAMKKMFFGVLF